MAADSGLTRDALISMQVIDARGRLVGKVKDVVFAIGQAGIALSVENESGQMQTVAWDQVQAASDFIILKPQPTVQAFQPQIQPVPQAYTSPVQHQPLQQPVQQPVQQQSSQPLCPICRKPLTWIPQYQRWYCYNDKKYA
jgi:sporulation protein YlmC with PRC-barrel domain